MELTVKVSVWLFLTFLLLGVASWARAKTIRLRKRLQLSFLAELLVDTLFLGVLGISFGWTMFTIPSLMRFSKLESIQAGRLMPVLFFIAVTLFLLIDIYQDKRDKNRY